MYAVYCPISDLHSVDVTLSTQLAWNPGRAGTTIVPGIRCYVLMENLINQVESSRVGANGKAPLLGIEIAWKSQICKHIQQHLGFTLNLLNCVKIEALGLFWGRGRSHIWGVRQVNSKYRVIQVVMKVLLQDVTVKQPEHKGWVHGAQPCKCFRKH